MNSSPLLTQSLRLARRELRGGLRGFGVFLTCLFLGVFAISAIGSFTEAAKAGLLSDASALLGGDLEVRIVHRELPSEAIDFLSRQGKLSHVMTMRTMAVSSNSDKRILAELKAVDSTYPLYGQIGISPEQQLSDAFDDNKPSGALVEQALLERLDAKIGDYVDIGSAKFRIRGVITSEPDRTIRAFNLGPRVMISLKGLAETGLLQPGSMVYHAYRLQLPDKEQTDQVKAELERQFPQAGWRLRVWREAAPRVRFFLDRMNQNLTLIGLCALLLGGLGVSGAVRGYLSGKIENIATMKCVGATGATIFMTYLLQILLLGAFGASAGLLLGAALPFVLNLLIGPHLPIPLVPAIYWSPLIKAALFGLLTALAFSLKALGVAQKVPPSVLFRGYSNETVRPDLWVRVLIVLSVVALAVMAIVTSTDRPMAFWFVCGAIICFALFRVAAAMVVKLARRLPKPVQPSLRLGLNNIHRRGSPSADALFSLGLGLTVLIIIVLVQTNLDDMVKDTVPNEAPSFFFLDLQSDQVEKFEELTRNIPGVVKVERYPTLRGRITAIADQPISKATIAQNVRWAVRGDRFLSYTAAMPPETKIVAGEWWPEEYAGEAKLSITADIAKGFGVSVGDYLTINVLGREVRAEIASLREVDWSTLELNFAIIFSPGVLETAPQTNIATIRVAEAQEEYAFRTITRALPNVSAISTREILKNVSATLNRIGTAFRSMAAIVLFTGFLVLAGSVSADQHRRIHDAVIFKVCGATRFDILAAFAAEFTILGLVAGTLSAAVGSLAAIGILKGLMKVSFAWHPGTILVTIVAGGLLTLLFGMLGTWKALGQKPAAYLRDE